jgi:hypothetical protein
MLLANSSGFTAFTMLLDDSSRCAIIHFRQLLLLLLSSYFYFLFYTITIMPSPLPPTSNHISTDRGDDISSVTSSLIGSNSHDAEFSSRNEVEISEDSTALETADEIIIDDEVEIREKTKTWSRKKHARSEVWKFFEVFKEMMYKSWAFCSLCQSDVYYTDTMSTGMLLRHLRKHHREEYNNVLDAEVQKQKKPKLDTDQPKIAGFVTYFPTFQKSYINWMVQTYQPISCCENSAFRTLCQSLNIKAPILGREKVRCLLTKEVLELRADVTTALKGMYFSATMDAWTANNNVNYSTCTVHFIDKKNMDLTPFCSWNLQEDRHI